MELCKIFYLERFSPFIIENNKELLLDVNLMWLYLNKYLVQHSKKSVDRWNVILGQWGKTLCKMTKPWSFSSERDKKSWMLFAFNENKGWANLKCKWAFRVKHDLLVEAKGQLDVPCAKAIPEASRYICLYNFIIWKWNKYQHSKTGKRRHAAAFRIRLNSQIIYSNSKVKSRKHKGQQQEFPEKITDLKGVYS